MSNRFIDSGDGTVTDTKTNLMWQKYSAMDQDGNPMRMSWKNAMSYCQNLDLCGYKDWRLPTLCELESLVDPLRYDPAIDTTFFPDTISRYPYYWSSTVYAPNLSKAWGIYFGSGDDRQHHQWASHYVRAVRSIGAGDTCQEV